MPYLDTVLIDDNDVRALPYLKVVGAISHWAPGDRRGGDVTVFGDDGELGSRLPLAKFIVSIPVRIFGDTRGERNDNLRELGSLIGGQANRGLVTIERRIATGSGSAHDSHTAPGRYITGLSMQIMSDVTGRTALQYYNLRGAWFDGTSWIYP